MYNPDWLRSAVPFKKDSNEPYKCLKYPNLPYNINGSITVNNNTCGPELFNISSQVKCHKWVFDDKEKTIVNDVSTILFKYYFYILPLNNIKQIPFTVWYHV